MKRSSKEWDLVKLALVQAEVVLKKLQEAMQDPKHSASLNPNTVQSVKQAKSSISESLNNADALSKVAEDIQYEKLVEDLNAIELPLTSKQYSVMEQLKGREGKS